MHTIFMPGPVWRILSHNLTNRKARRGAGVVGAPWLGFHCTHRHSVMRKKALTLSSTLSMQLVYLYLNTGSEVSPGLGFVSIHMKREHTRALRRHELQLHTFDVFPWRRPVVFLSSLRVLWFARTVQEKIRRMWIGSIRKINVKLFHHLAMHVHNLAT
jgi:hypothetical protein